jgi:hypothetical protein
MPDYGVSAAHRAYGQPVANLLLKQTKSFTFIAGGMVLPSQLA